jgi:CelD/BcsL family acetyltransferase involved in cellulose biosynthesis
MNWKIVPIRDFTYHRDAWNRLNSAEPNSALLHSDFIEPLLKVFGGGNERMAIYGNITDPQVMALLVPRRFGVWETFQPSQLPVGPWLNSAALPLDQLLQQLSRALPGLALILSITQQDPDFYERPENSAHLITLDHIPTAKVRVEGNFEQYWSQRGKNLRHNLNRQRNRLQRENVTVRLETLTDPATVATVIRDYGKLESAGWKSKEGTAIHPSNAQGRFYTALLDNFCRRGMGRIYRYWYDDKLVATDLCIQQNGVLVILKTTYDETITTSSPAMLMRYDYFENIFNEGAIHTIEFYGRVMEWHRRMTKEVRMLYHINYFPWPALKKIHRLLCGFNTHS